MKISENMIDANEVPAEFLDFARQISEPVIADIGSRDALDGLYLLQQLNGSELHIFEPNPQAATLCRQHIEKFGNISKIFFNETALAAEAGNVDFYPVNQSESEKKDIGLSSMFQVNPRYSKRRGKIIQNHISVPAITMDSYFKKKNKPDILWMDVEGAELLVLKGGIKTLEQVKVIHIEVGFRAMHLKKPLFWEIDEFLQKAGFKIWKFMGVSAVKAFLAKNRLLPNLPWRWNAVYSKEL
jgi:FkbM family methyltransferase